LLGVQPLIGRTFVTNEDNGSERVAVLSHELWAQRFASDGGVVGRSIALDGEQHTVIGVMPPQFVLRTFQAQLWTPLPLNAIGEGKAARENRFLTVLGRLRPGITQKQAAAEISGLAKRAEQDFSQTEKGWGANALSMQDYQTKDLNAGPGMVILMSAVGCVLMIACANVAGLLLARATARRKEIGLRLALGARRRRIVLQLMTESLLLAALGGITGTVLAYWGANLVRSHMASQPELRILNVGIDGNVLLLTAGLSVCTAFLFGLVPALQAARSDVQSALKAGGLNASNGRSSNHLRGALVIGQFALAVVLLSGTGLLLKAIYNQMHGDLGFDSHRLLTAQISIPEKYYQTAVSRNAFYMQLLQRTSVLPEVGGAAITSNLPAAGGPEVDVSFKGQEDLPPSQRVRSRYFVVDPGYLRTLSITLLRGRGFLESDNTDSPKVTVVNEAFVHKFFPGSDAIGKVVRIDTGDEGKQEWRQIVGVVGNVKNWPLQTTNDPEIYESCLQRPPSSMFIALRTSGDPDQLIAPLRQAVFSIDKMLPVSNAQSMANLVDDETGMDRFLSSLLATFAAAAVVLAGIGIYGVVAYTVGQRTREIGIRVALGGGRASVRRLVMIAGMKLGALGGCIGLLLSLPLPRAFAGMLMDFHIKSGPVFIVVPSIIVATTLLACYIPARRAVRINPTVALRCE
jgi:putative ABC transport system permease protein